MSEKIGLEVETVKTACEYIDKVEIVVSELLENRYNQDFTEIMRELPDIVDGIEWLTNVINRTSEYQKQPFDIKEFNEVFSQIVEAIERKDEGLVYDIFEYEFLPVLKRCKMNFIDESNYLS